MYTQTNSTLAYLSVESKRIKAIKKERKYSYEFIKLLRSRIYDREIVAKSKSIFDLIQTLTFVFFSRREIATSEVR